VFYSCVVSLFLTEVFTDTTQEMLPQLNNDPVMDEVQGEWELDDLVIDLHKEWEQHEGKKEGKNTVQQPDIKKHLETESNSDHISFLSPISEPILRASDKPAVSKYQCINDQPTPNNSTPITTGPWSLDWLSNVPCQAGGLATSTTCSKADGNFVFVAGAEASGQQHAAKKKNNNNLKHSAVFLKRVARMSSTDRREILKILKKKDRKRKE